MPFSRIAPVTAPVIISFTRWLSLKEEEEELVDFLQKSKFLSNQAFTHPPFLALEAFPLPSDEVDEPELLLE